MKIAQAVNEIVLSRSRDRLQKLKELQAPEIVWKREEEIVARCEAGFFRVQGMDKLGQIEIISREVKTGRGGKTYVVFQTAEGPVYLFDGKHGKFLTKDTRDKK